MSAKPFTGQEFTHLSAHFASARQRRNLALLKLGCGTGYRISELLSLGIADIRDGRVVRSDVTVTRRHLKGGRS